MDLKMNTKLQRCWYRFNDNGKRSKMTWVERYGLGWWRGQSVGVGSEMWVSAGCRATFRDVGVCSKMRTWGQIYRCGTQGASPESKIRTRAQRCDRVVTCIGYEVKYQRWCQRHGPGVRDTGVQGNTGVGSKPRPTI